MPKVRDAVDDCTKDASADVDVIALILKNINGIDCSIMIVIRLETR